MPACTGIAAPAPVPKCLMPTILWARNALPKYALDAPRVCTIPTPAELELVRVTKTDSTRAQSETSSVLRKQFNTPSDFGLALPGQVDQVGHAHDPQPFVYACINVIAQ